MSLGAAMISVFTITLAIVLLIEPTTSESKFSMHEIFIALHLMLETLTHYLVRT